MNEPSLTNQDGGDAFQVMFGAGELRILSLDELDEAFNAGKVDERTFVLAPGSSEWTRLGELLGLDSAPEPPPAAPVAAPRPIAHDPFLPAAVAAPVAPPVIQMAAPAPEMGLPSTRPVAFDMDDLSEEQLRPKRRAPMIIACAMVALGVGGFFAYRSSQAPSDASLTAAAAAAAVPAVAPVTTPTVTPSVPVTAPIDDNKRPVLTDDQKARLADADKQHAAKAAATHAARAASSSGGSHHGKHVKDKVFNNGGAAGDPLNAAL